MTTDDQIRDLLRGKAVEMQMDRYMPAKLARKVTRRQRLLALSTIAALVVITATTWVAIDSVGSSQAIPPASRDENVGWSEPNAQNLVGMWKTTTEQGLLLVRFGDDGSFSIGKEPSDPALSGTYEIARDQILFHATHGVCPPDDKFTWRAQISDQGRMKMTSVEDAAGDCSIGIGTQWVLQRLGS